MKITIGKSGTLDVELLLRTRLLIQGSSGSGKSWLLRRLAEQLFGKVPVIIIDPEGEFATLREQFGYVLVGPGGETPADVRSAALVAHKLLELHASAVCDIYEMKPQDRHRWVKLFLEALIDAPKKLWQPAVIIVDESHLFAPESGAGVSEASDAMIGLATRGRKRGFCAVFATQRLGKLRKDAAAELTNVLIGLTSIDIDRDRAIEALGVSRSEKADVSHQLKTLKEGQFWGFGRAIAVDRTLIQVGDVQTTHPKLGTSRLEPPPPPEKVRALLPKLADLPQQAEQKALTEKELRQQIQQLRRELAAKPSAAPTPTAKRVEVAVLKDGQLARAEKIVAHAERVIGKAQAVATELNDSLTVAFLRETAKEIAEAIASTRAVAAPVYIPPHNATAKGPTLSVYIPKPRQVASNGDGGEIKGKALDILNGLAELEALRAREPKRILVAMLAGYSNLASTGFVKALSSLSAGGYVHYPNPGTVALTDAGRSVAQFQGAPRTSEEIQQRVLQLIGGKAGEILTPLIASYPHPLDRMEVANAAGYTNLASTGFVKALSRLSSLGFVAYPSPRMVAAQPVLFLEGA